MSATEELRRLLTEAGVEWDADDVTLDDGSLSQVTYWYSNGIEWSADGRDEYLAFDAVQLITPKQAIAATLGPGTCHDTHEARWFRCSACGFGIEDMYVSDEDEYPPEDQPKHCPNCGRKVVDA